MDISVWPGVREGPLTKHAGKYMKTLGPSFAEIPVVLHSAQEAEALSQAAGSLGFMIMGIQ